MQVLRLWSDIPIQSLLPIFPVGMDATVSWGILDYKFKNNTEYPVKIQDSYANGAIFVQILGTREG